MPRWLHWLAHSWTYVRCMGAWRYWRCRHCGVRKATRFSLRIIGPRAEAWLAGGSFDTALQHVPVTSLARAQRAIAHVNADSVLRSPEVVGLRQIVRDRDALIADLRGQRDQLTEENAELRKRLAELLDDREKDLQWLMGPKP